MDNKKVGLVLSLIAAGVIIGASIGISTSIINKSKTSTSSTVSDDFQSTFDLGSGSNSSTSKDTNKDTNTTDTSDSKTERDPSVVINPVPGGGYSPSHGGNTPTPIEDKPQSDAVEEEEDTKEVEPTDPIQPMDAKYENGGIYILSTNMFYSFEKLKNDNYINYYADGKLTADSSKLNNFDPFIFTIPLDIKYIASKAFENCTKLTKVYFPTSLTSIESKAFYGCSNLSELWLPEGFKSIGEGAFQYTGIKQIFIPSSLVNIDIECFRWSREIESIIVSVNNYKYDSRNNCNAIVEKATNKVIFGCKNTTFPDSIKIIGTKSFMGCGGPFTFTLPKGVSKIEESAFCNTYITSVTINRRNVVLEKNIFEENDKLISASLPDDIEELPYGLFDRCSNLETCNFPSKLVKINDLVFNKCAKLFNLDLQVPKSLKHIGYAAFAGTALNRIKFDDASGPEEYNIEYIGSSAFLECPNLSGGVYFSDKLEKIGSNAFYNCPKITEFFLYTSVKEIGVGAFHANSSVQIRYKGTRQQFNSIPNNPYTNDERVICLGSQ